MKTRLIAFLWLLGAGLALSQDGGGGRLYKQCPGCLTGHQSDSIRAMLERHEASKPAEEREAADGSNPTPYSFYPHAGILAGGDAFLTNYTDLDSSGSIGDPFCGTRTYNGHRGIDTDILTWDMQDAGVPVFAVLGGTVIASHDGEFDRNTTWNNQPANFVVIDHGGGHITKYYHFKKDSVLVDVNDVVVAGQQIGLVGSSGISTAPHLHFQTELNGVVTEPFSGPCGPSSSLFARQEDVHPEMYIRDFTITTQNLGSWSGPPDPTTSEGKFLINTTPTIYFWINLMNMTPSTSYRIRFLRPDGSVALSGNTNSFSSSYTWSWWWWSRNVNLNMLGTWTVEFSLNGQVAVAAPFEVVDAPFQLANQAPNAAPVIFENPLALDEVPVCRIATFDVLDDPEYDLVRYRYVWKVNGTVHRDVTTAAKADAFPQGIGGPGDTLSCEVTPTDGSLNGVMSSVSASYPDGTVPEISVEQPTGISLTDNASAIDFGSVAAGGNGLRTFTIRNLGTGTLNNLGVAVTGAQASSFIVGNPGASSLGPGSSTTFQVSFSPSATGSFSAGLQISSNDSDENPFDLALAGVGVAPEIAVEHPVGTGLVDGAALVDFGDAMVGGSVQRSFTIRNLGTSNLTGLSASFSGTAAGNYSVSAISQTTLAPGAQTQFSVTFSPSVAGTRSASLRISSNDADENPFDVALTGAGLAPEIAVEEPVGNGLVDGASLVDFGGAMVGGSFQKTFTIRNLGTANLTGLATSFSGSAMGDYSATALGQTSLAPGAQLQFSVTFSPSADGTRAAVLRISSNDSDENPFDINLSGAGAGPEIVIEYPTNVSLIDGSSTINFSSVAAGTTSPRLLTVRNTGAASLTGLAASIGGADDSLYSVSSFASTTLAPGASTTLTVSFSPDSSGIKRASLQVLSNDSDESPFNILLSGSGTVSEIDVSSPPGSALVDGAATIDFGAAQVGVEVNQMMRIRNLGTASLTGLAITIDGSGASSFSAAALPATTLGPGQSRTIAISYLPSAGTSSAMLHISSNDSDENPFDIALTGFGGLPDLEVLDSGGGLLENGVSEVRFEDHGGTPTSVSITLRNGGAVPLLGITASLEGTNAENFEIISPPASTLAANATSNIQVQFDTEIFGENVATLRVESSDPEESPFLISLAATRVLRTTLSDWAGSFGLSGASLLPGADDDADLLTLVEEYAFGLDPTVQDNQRMEESGGGFGVPRIQLIGAGPSARLRAMYIRRISDPLLNYVVEFGNEISNDPVSGFLEASEPESVEEIDTFFQRVEVEDSEQLGDEGKRFGRVRVLYGAP